jgi:hypothetical protein
MKALTTCTGKCGRGLLFQVIRGLSVAVLMGSLGVAVVGCNGTISTESTATQTANTAQTYLAAGVGNLQEFVIDHSANTFTTSCFADTTACSSNNPNNTAQWTLIDSGTVSQLSNGIFDLDITYYPGQTLSTPPLTGNWVIEIPGQAALMELETPSTSVANTSFAPLVPTQSCPSLATATNFQFVTIPKSLNTSTALVANGWSPQLETAYGSVSVATTGASVQFSNITQHTFPGNNGTSGTPANPASATASSVCYPTFYGDTMSIPGSVTVVNPGSQGTASVSPSATIGIGSSGFLLEDSGSAQGLPDASIPYYENVLGAGYGAIGMPEPTSALTTSSVVTAQYQGILYGAASGSSASIGARGFRLIGSFGYSNLQTACPTLPAPSTSTIIYGGEFANNNPSANAYGNCDLAIDLGSQGANNNGLYPAATVYVSAAFPYNGIKSTYSFPAVAIAGQIAGKYAIFLIGVDTAGSPSQPWGIYLIQSN